MIRVVFLFSLAFTSLAQSEDDQKARVQLEGPVTNQVPSGWQVKGQADSATRLELTFAVKQSNLQELHDTLMQVSTPSSPTYGQHMTNAEVQALTAPRAEDVAAVTGFLLEHGIKAEPATPNKDLIHATVTVEQAEALLGTTYSVLHHEKSGIEIMRALGGYSLPSHVAQAVDFVSPTVHIPGVHRPTPSNSTTLDQLGGNSPKNLRKLYEIDVEGKASSNKQAVTAFLEQYYSKMSLGIFHLLECGGITCGKGDVKLVGDATTGFAGTESMLDIEYITGVAGNIESEFWGFKGRSPENPENEPFMKWLAQLSNTSDADVPKIFSTSYGEDEGSWSLAAAKRLNVEFQKAGARGISLLYASGDEGANCKGGKFVPEGPASSPYVTAVGGTKPGSSWPEPGTDAEEAIGLSSGGFSNYWEMPSYQKTAVQGYLSQGGLPDKEKRGYNTSGRAVPDISAQATNFPVVAGLPIPMPVAGTSCASPTAAAIFSLLNDLRLQKGQSTLGFLNPLIYEHAAAFNDITEGAGSGCGLADGWPAKKGWDAVTGVGTPSYARLAAVVSKLPSGKRQTTSPSPLQVMV